VRPDEHKIRYLDCAVSGGPRGAEGGILAALVGGDEETFARAQGVIGCFSDKITHLGPPGSGHLVKAMNNAMLGAQVRKPRVGASELPLHRWSTDLPRSSIL
jgi:3-hydroxyisobutyrate dehydrogenase-like beta-hydroxyacid dehydrogenase